MIFASRENGVVVGHSNAQSYGYFVQQLSPGMGHRAEAAADGPSPEELLARLERLGVGLREPALLGQAVAVNPEMVDLLEDAVRELTSAFGDRATIVLEPHVDPEVEKPQVRVFVLAVTHLPFVRADEILDGVLDGWWTNNQSRADYLVSLATELV